MSQRCSANPLSLTLPLRRALAALADGEGLSRQEIIGRAVLDRYERTGHAKRVEDSTDRMIERWGDVLDRLGAA